MGFADVIRWLLDNLYVPLGWVLNGILYLLLSIPWYIMDGFLTVIETLIASINYSSVVFQWAAGYALLPSQAVYVMNAVGFPQFVTIVAAAYAVRLLINLIPSWATRV